MGGSGFAALRGEAKECIKLGLRCDCPSSARAFSDLGYLPLWMDVHQCWQNDQTLSPCSCESRMRDGTLQDH